MPCEEPAHDIEETPYGAGTCCRLFAAACGRKEEAVRRRDQENRAYSAAGGFPGISHTEKNWRI